MSYIIMHGTHFHLQKSAYNIREHLLHPTTYCQPSGGWQVCPFEKDMPCMELGSAQRSAQRDDLPRASVIPGKERLYSTSSQKEHPQESPFAP